MLDSDQKYRMTLVGPSGTKAPKLLRLGPWTRSEWRKIIVEVQVGSAECPDWDHANRCVQAVQDLIKFSNGNLTDHVLDALKTHMNVISFQTFRGPG